jgi:hypothetical protein
MLIRFAKLTGLLILFAAAAFARQVKLSAIERRQNGFSRRAPLAGSI